MLLIEFSLISGPVCDVRLGAIRLRPIMATGYVSVCVCFESISCIEFNYRQKSFLTLACFLAPNTHHSFRNSRRFASCWEENCDMQIFTHTHTQFRKAFINMCCLNRHQISPMCVTELIPLCALVGLN